MSKLKIAAVQMKSGQDRDENLVRAVEMAALAAERGARIVAFPQLFSLPWFPCETRPESFELAESMDGPTVAALSRLAREQRVVVVGSVFERDGDNHYNTAVVIEGDGSLIGRYRKIHIPQIPLWEERSYFTPGDLGFPVFATSVGRIGVQICWDNFFPEGTRILALRGAQLIVAPTASAFASHNRWERMISGNAIANNVFVLRVNRVGAEEKQEFYGKSFCVGPFGDLIAPPAGGRDAIVFSEVNLDEVGESREIWTFMKDRRPELYGEISG